MTVDLFEAADTRGFAPTGTSWVGVVPDGRLRKTTVPGDHYSLDYAVIGRAITRRLSTAGDGLPAEASYEPVIRLQFGDSAKAPFFCVPGAGASVTAFADLAGALGSARPVYGLQPRGLDGAMVPHASVSAAAECYLRAIEALQVPGPIHLLGHSFGGWVAFEMALRLTDAGREVASLTLVDTDVPEAGPDGVRERSQLEAFREFVDVLELSAERSLEIDEVEIEALGEESRLALLHERLVSVELVPRRSTPDVLHGVFRVFARCVRVGYRPARAYRGPVRLVLARDSRLDEAENQRLFMQAEKGWRDWVQDLELTTTSGNHMTALKRPHVDGWATLVAGADLEDGAG